MADANLSAVPQLQRTQRFAPWLAMELSQGTLIVGTPVVYGFV